MTGPPEGPPAVPPSQPYPAPGPVQPHRGVVVLVLGILGIVVCCALGIVAWVMGNNDLREMTAGRMDPSGRQMTNVGRILGIISVCLAAVGVVIWIVWIAIFGVAAGFGALGAR